MDATQNARWRRRSSIRTFAGDFSKPFVGTGKLAQAYRITKFNPMIQPDIFEIQFPVTR